MLKNCIPQYVQKGFISGVAGCIEHVFALVDGSVRRGTVHHLGQAGEILDARLRQLKAHHHR